MPFFKDLRRRSRASIRTSELSAQSTSTIPIQKSSSTLGSGDGSATPPSGQLTDGSTPNLSMKNDGESGMSSNTQRPSLMTTSTRNSMIMISPSSTNMRATPPNSIYAPKVISIVDNSVVYQKILLIQGEIDDPRSKTFDGNLTIHHDKDGMSFPPTNWPVSESFFKALVYLSPGWNRIRFEFTCPKLNHSGNQQTVHSSYMMLNYLPLSSAPPLQLVILLGKDSPGTFDATPMRIAQEGNNLEMAIRKFRMAAHLWQAFTAEQMHRHKFGRRCFRYDEEWQTGTLSVHDLQMGVMKNETKVHVVRCDKTVSELRDLSLAQQYGPAERKGELYTITADAVKRYFGIRPGQKQYVAALLLDAHWDRSAGVITGHAALGGTGDDLGLAIFGSQAIQSYPSCIEEVGPAFMDCTRTDTNYVANDCNESGSSWEAANIGIGAHLHEVGHLFGCPHQESGVMLRDYVRLNRTFCVREPFSTRTKSPGLKVCRIEDECNWHRLDALRFRHHPCFRIPSDESPVQDDSIQFYPVGSDRFLLLAATGISFIEIFADGDDVCKSYIEYANPDPRASTLPKQVTVTEAEMRSRLPEDKRKSKLRLTVFAGSSRSVSIDDISEILSKEYIINLPAQRQSPRRDEGLTMNAVNGVMGFGKSFDTRQGFKSRKLGTSSQEGSQSIEVILESINLHTKLLTSVKVHSGFAVDGLEFCYEDGKSQLFGKRGGKPGGDEFYLDTRRGETILGFNLRAGAWIDGIEILTSNGRRSGMYGNAMGGSPHTLMAPRGFTFAGVSGSCGKWLDGFQIIITR